MCGASRCAARCANSRTRRVSSRKTRMTVFDATRRETRRGEGRFGRINFFPRDSARLSSPSRVASSLEPNEPNRTNRTDDRSMDGVGFPVRDVSRVVARSTRRRRENGAFAHGSRSALRLHDVSRAPRVRGVASRRGRVSRVANAATLPGRASRRSDDDDRSVRSVRAIVDANRERGVRAVGIDDRRDDDDGDDSEPAARSRRRRGTTSSAIPSKSVAVPVGRARDGGVFGGTVRVDVEVVRGERVCGESASGEGTTVVTRSRRRSGCLLRRRVARGIFG